MYINKLFLAVVAMACSVGVRAKTAAAEVYKIPVMELVKVDGDAAEWEGKGFDVAVLAQWQGAVTASPEFKLAWSPDGLALLARVADTTPDEVAGNQDLWSHDSVEIFVASTEHPEQRVQIAIAPGVDPKGGGVRVALVDTRSLPQKVTFDTHVSAKARADARGYRLEALVPWADLPAGIHHSDGSTHAWIQLQVNDAGGGAKRFWTWYPSALAYKDGIHAMYEVESGKEPSAPVQVAVSGAYEKFRPRIEIAVAEGAKGKAVRIERDGVSVASGEAPGSFLLPIPKPDAWEKPIVVRVDGQPAVSLSIAPPGGSRQTVIGRVPFHFATTVFAGEQFPAAGFEDSQLAGEVVGPHKIVTRYFDASGNEVSKAAKAGRYGAVAEVRASDGATIHKRATLYRFPDGVDWRNITMQAESGKLLSAFGVSEPMEFEYAREISDTLKSALRESAARSDAVAVLLCGLSEAGASPAQSAEAAMSVNARNARWWVQLEEKQNWPGYEYLIHLPTHYADEPSRKWPLVIALHGSGVGGKQVSDVADQGLPHRIATDKAFADSVPMIMVSPRAVPPESWNVYRLDRLLRELAQQYRVDEDRIIITGFSMGGFGTWSLASAYPHRFAAIVPICGSGNVNDAAKFKHLPVWAFHGEMDPTVPLKGSTSMVEAINAAGGHARLTVYPGVGHDAWTRAYNEPELYEWMLKQKRQ